MRQPRSARPASHTMQSAILAAAGGCSAQAASADQEGSVSLEPRQPQHGQQQCMSTPASPCADHRVSAHVQLLPAPTSAAHTAKAALLPPAPASSPQCCTAAYMHQASKEQAGAQQAGVVHFNWEHPAVCRWVAASPGGGRSVSLGGGCMRTDVRMRLPATGHHTAQILLASPGPASAPTGAPWTRSWRR
jgi:hypothetical protein